MILEKNSFGFVFEISKDKYGWSTGIVSEAIP